MIMLTRLAGTEFALNPDLIERIDSAPDTVITLVDGKKYVVSDSMATVCERISRYRSDVVHRPLMTGDLSCVGDEDDAPTLAPVRRLKEGQ